MNWLASPPMLVPAATPSPTAIPAATPSDLWWAGYLAGFWVMFWIAVVVMAAFFLGLAIGKGWIHAPRSSVPGWVTHSGQRNT